MKYHFYSSVSLSILVRTTREDRYPKHRLWNDETSHRPRLIGSLSPSIRGGGPRFCCGPSLIPVSLLFFYDSSSWHRQKHPFQQMQPLPFKAKRQAVEERRQQERSMEAVRTERRGEQAVSLTLKVSSSPQLSVLSTLPPEGFIQRLT